MDHKIIIFTTSEGHLSIAQAIEDQLKSIEGKQTQIFFFHEPGLALYRLSYRYFPKIFGFIFKMAKLSRVNSFLNLILHLEHDRIIDKILQTDKPDLIFNTSFGFTPTLSKLKPKYQYKFINVIPNPRSFFYQDLATEADLNGIFDNKTNNIIKSLQPNLKTLISGWFVRSRFKTIPDDQVSKLRRKLNLTDIPTLLMITGSEGMATIKDLITRLTESSTQSVQIVVACGHNRNLKQSLQQMKVADQIKLVVLSFVDNLHEYMQTADLIVGKAGPNSIFEAIACGKPFFATSHIAGLEEGSLEIIKEYQIGWVEENPQRAAEKIVNFLNNHQEVASKTVNAKKLAAYLRDQSEKFLADALAI